MLQNIQAEFIENLFNGDDTTADFPHFKIYQNNIHANLLAVLKSIYPLLIKLLGDDFFKQCADGYILCYPSRSGNIHDYGEYFADFLSEFEFTHDIPYLKEVARFEWHCHCLQFAPDHAALDLHKIENLSPDRMDQIRFTLHPASWLHAFQYPLLDIIDLCHGRREQELNLDEAHGINLLCIRRTTEIALVTLNEGEFTFLSQINDGVTLGDALTRTLAVDPHFHLEQKLPQWVSDKTIVDCYELS